MPSRVRRGAGKAPSPWLFALAFPLALGLVGWACLAVPPRPSRAEVDWYFDTPRLARLNGPGPPRVMAFGSSLVAYGLAFDESMEARASRRGQRIRFLRFAKGGLDLRWLQELLDRVEDDPPEVLVLEAELLFWKQQAKGPDAWESRIRVFERILWRGDRLLFGGRPRWILDGMNQPAFLKDSLVPAPRGFDPQVYAKYLATVHPRSAAETRLIFERLRAIQDRGCRVVVYSMGRSPAATAHFTPALELGFREFMARAAAAGLRTAGSAPLPQACYRDAAHLDDRGRDLASDQFLDGLGHWLGTPP